MSDRVLVTGGAGFIGSHSVSGLLAQGFEVRVLDSLAERVHGGQEPPRWLAQEAEFLRGDVRDLDVLAHALKDVDLVLHLAAYQDYLPDVSTFSDVNVTGTARIYETIIRRQLPVKKIVVASSQSVYGEGRYHCGEDGPVSPDPRPDGQLARGDWEIRCPLCGGLLEWLPSMEAHVKPANAYGASKLSKEYTALTLGRRYGIPTTCLRYSITNGRWQSPRNAYSGICRIFVQQVLQGRSPVLYEDGMQLRDYCYVGDVVSANLLALTDSRTDFDVFNVGGANVLSVRQYAQLVLDVLGSEVELEIPGVYRYGDNRHSISSSARLEALGWHASGLLRDVIAEYAGWYREESSRTSSNVVDTAMQDMMELGVLRSRR